MAFTIGQNRAYTDVFPVDQIKIPQGLLQIYVEEIS